MAKAVVRTHDGQFINIDGWDTWHEEGNFLVFEEQDESLVALVSLSAVSSVKVEI